MHYSNGVKLLNYQALLIALIKREFTGLRSNIKCLIKILVSNKKWPKHENKNEHLYIKRKNRKIRIREENILSLKEIFWQLCRYVLRLVCCVSCISWRLVRRRPCQSYRKSWKLCSENPSRLCLLLPTTQMLACMKIWYTVLFDRTNQEHLT